MLLRVPLIETVSGSTLRSRSAILGNALLIAGSLVVCGLIVEIALSFVLPTPILWVHPQESYLHDSSLGHKLTPNQKGFSHSFPVLTNSYGLRDAEVSVVPSPGTVRILCLGDSLTFGAGVPSEATYPKQLEALLNKNVEPRYEVINAGVPGYDTWQEVTYFRESGWKWQADTVIIGFYGNDIVPKPNVIRHTITEAGSVSRHGISRFVPNRVAYFFKKSHLLLLLRDRWGKLMSLVNAPPEHRHQRALLEGTQDDFVERGWAEVETSLKEMTVLQSKYGFRLLLVVFPMAEQLLNEHPNAQYQSRIKVIAAKYQMPVIDLLPSFQINFKGFSSLFIEWDGHPNPAAYAIAATEVQQYMMQTPKGLRRANF